ncbi:MAG TPA: DmsE family decaheme c-type cytochrome [Methylomirabilota bacterium]|nr:DmsE family decaheme c-type cytochrome [Methylomirabilota bacterium]
MTGSLWKVSGVVAGAALALGVLVLPWPVPAQSPPTSSAQSPAAPAATALPTGYMGAEVCKACHEEAFRKFETTKMGRLFLKQPRNMQERLACESCHGPGQKHVEAGGGKGAGGMITFAKNDPTPVERRNAACTACHSRGPHLFWKGSAHEARDVACTGCHKVMEHTGARAQLAKATEIETCGTCHLQKRAQQMRFSHMPLREGKMTCTSCHNPHGGVNHALLKEPTLNDTCFTCHAEKRGPFLWPHAPVNESCVNCHDPHGSNHQAMLRIAKPRLCQSCHIESRHPTNPYGRDTPSLKFVMGRSCSNCHVNIHGSNHPSGFAFTR